MSTYSTSLKLELITPGSQSGTWGDTTNRNLGTLLEQAIAGVQTITIGSANYVLSNLNGVSDEARNAVLVVTGTPSGTRTILVPNGQSKVYIVYNNTTGNYNINVQTWSGSGLTGVGNSATIQPGASTLIYCTGSDCFTVAPYTAYTATPVVFQGYASTSAGVSTLTVTSVTSGTLAIGQTVYNPGIFYTPSGFPSNTTITAFGSGTTGGVGTYTLSSTGSNVVGSASAPQTIIALATLNQIATVDYTQSKMQSPYFQGSPSADTANAAAFEGQISTTGTYTGVLIASKYYVAGGYDIKGNKVNYINLGQYLNGSYISDGAYVSSWGTGTPGNATFSGYISANTLTVISGSVTGSITSSQYLEANGSNLAVGTKIAGGSGLSWSTSGVAQTVGSATNPVVFNAYGPLTSDDNAFAAAVNNTGGWVNLQNDAQPMATSIRTPMISFLSPLQLSNVLFSSNIASLVGTLGTQSDTAVNILGGTIANTALSNCTGVTAAAGTSNTQLATNAFATSASVPPGTIIQYAGTTAPTGFLACPIAAATISRTTYANLFTAIGTTWGAGDGSTTFGIPYFAAGFTGLQSNSNVGTSTVGQVISHTHTYSLAGGLQPQSGSSTLCLTNLTTSNTGPTGGTNNLAAGTYLLHCVKY